MTPAILRLWTRRKPRERATIALVILVSLGLLLDHLWLAPLRSAYAHTQREANTLRKEVKALQEQVAEQSRQGDEQLAQLSAALQARRVHAEKIIRDAQIDLISPQEMREQLEAILMRFPQLKVLSVKSQPPAPLGDMVGNTDAAPALAGANVAPGVYQHGLEVKVEGRYFDLIAYLEALEKTPRRVYWRELDLSVNGQGIPVTRIALFTLSKEAVWMRI
ncbi:MAG TPA: hypothetical protein PLQ67_01885 [Burkholderiaceae bacterium]|nr:hypothetical protein [Burkholderiaceae bacterium]